ncbi:MAG: YIP1 family protein [Burkholderiaceae bacterium]|nr:YIP1 family protein [Burkholderiaceae bacterium]
MRGLLLVLFWPDAVWRHLRETPLAPRRLIFRLAVPLALGCAFALQIGTGSFNVDAARADARIGPITAPIFFAIWLGAVLAMALAFTLLAPRCKGRQDFARSLNLAFFGLAPAWFASLASVALPMAALSPFALAWSGYLLSVGARILLDVDAEESGSFLVRSGAAMIVATGALGVILGSFAFQG